MAGILDLLNSDMGKTIINGVAGQTKQSEDKTSQVLTMALPVLMQAMKRNAATPQGAEGLLSALNSKQEGNILDNLGGLFSGGVNADVLTDGSKILGHVLGGKQQHVENAIGARAGVDAESVANILKVAAPLLMGMLAKQTKEKSVSSPSGLEGMLGGLLSGSSSKNEQSFLESILDADGDGSIIDDVAGMILGGSKKKGGLGGLLGGLFGK
ncbi:DUF937 domain-containing protein [Xanthomarina sp.]|uniref:DUF937 domain-containing protein n=1 Tax=Xanthomarina sp. TaxID=1931211 RepID=UPI002B9CA3C5|nr:DUF937 domain-containing protein [Xanthomarina sp.]HLV39013.1 DUF937 domain-containing protein [Xanthomarina sp.]